MPASIRMSYTSGIIARSVAEGWGFNYWHYGNPTDDGGLDPDVVIAASGYGPAPPPVEPPPVTPPVTPPVEPPPVTPPVTPPMPVGASWIPISIFGGVIYLLAKEVKE
jgi:hypothetical protein